MITKIDKKPNINVGKRVAAYCRVSTDAEKQLHSLSAQVSYYNELIQKTPNWEFAGIFSDEGISGRTTEREGFQKLLDACEKGKVDIVLTKSISRFARNTVDLLDTIRYLKHIGVEVRFERENINTFTSDGELLTTLLAAFAQAESENLSTNVRWAIQNKLKKGQPFNHKLFGYEWIDGEAHIIEKEAEIVRKVYQYCIDGMTARAIAKQLNEEGYVRKNGKSYTLSAVEYLLNQERYTGDEILQKYYQDPVKHRRVKNEGQFPKYIVLESIPSIISRETYNKAHRILAGRRYTYGHTQRGFELSPLSRKLYCTECGKRYSRHYSGNNRNKPYWVCWGKSNYKNCHAENITEGVAKTLIAMAMNTSEFDEELFTKSVDKVLISPGPKIRVIYKEGNDGERDYYHTTD